MQGLLARRLAAAGPHVPSQPVPGGGGWVLVLYVHTERCCPTAARVSGSGPPPTMWHKTDRYYNEDFYLRIYKLSLHFLGQHWGLAPSWHWQWRTRPAPQPMVVRLVASGVVGWLLQAFKGELAPVR